MNKNEWHQILGEEERIYHYANGKELSFVEVSALKVSNKGTHYLEYGGGHKAVVPAGWQWLYINASEWSV